MTRILICGKDSYIGKSLILELSRIFEFDELDLTNNDWRDYDFSKYDTLIHLAAIVHRPEVKDKELYFKVNSDLPNDVAIQAINQGVKHFIFFSTMGVYGKSPSLHGDGKISANSNYLPDNLYGLSKLAAEIRLIKMQSELNFVLTIIRPPNVYGENCPGNYYHFMRYCAKYLFIFPLLRHNKFSMINIKELCIVVQNVIQNRTRGIICPQDNGDQSNALRIRNMAIQYGKFHSQSKVLGKLLYIIFRIYPFKQISNLFGDLFYDETLAIPLPFEKFAFYNIKEQG
jgi:UDP-glucose 4-epimerase